MSGAPPWRRWVSVAGLSTLLAVILSGFHLWTGGFGLLEAMLQRGVHLALGLLLVYLTRPVRARTFWAHVALNWIPTLAAAAATGYFLIMANPQQWQLRAFTGPTDLDLYMGGLLIIVLLEATRRIIGWPLVIVACVFLVYHHFGPWMPGLLAHRGYSVPLMIEQLVYTHEGIFTTPLAVSATFVALFIIFGAFLELSGAGQWFIDLAYGLTGGTRSGPAMTAVVSSALMGSINGVAAANVVTTGAFTIPLMKRLGYKPHFAGGVEAAASTGGQLLPPIMGAGAFIMAEVMGVPYAAVALAAAIPAILYFVAVGVMVHLEALRLGLRGMPREELPQIGKVFREGIQFMVPILVLVFLLVVVRYTPMKAALYATVVVWAMSLLRPSTRMGIDKVIQACKTAAENMLPVLVACATAGIVVGVVIQTGLGLKFSNLVIQASGGNVLLALLLTALACLVLGMGLPTSAAYIITAALGAPALVSMGVDRMAAHLFVFYFACISVLTPPVAIAGYAAAGVAQSDPIRTSVEGFRLAGAAYIVPFFFVYGPALLLVGSPGQIVWATVTAVVGACCLAVALQGYLVSRMTGLWRLVFLAAALLLVRTGAATDVPGLVLAALGFLWQWRNRRAEGAVYAGESY